MRATVMRDWTLHIEEIPDPEPGPGQVLARVLACGICGSDLHLLKHGPAALALQEELAAAHPPDPEAPVMFDPAANTVMGHEFCCEVVALGPDCQQLKEGDVVVSLPVAVDDQGLHGLGFSSIYPGGYGELMILNDAVALPVQGGLPPELAALTEPLAVGVHAVAKSGIVHGEAAIVLGCGPVGLAVIVALKLIGVGPIVAADFSPARRELAARFGATEVVDPAVGSAIEAWRRVDGSRPLVIFEAVGVPGMIDAAMRMAPAAATRIVVVGVCMQPDAIQPYAGIGRELSIQFALGYTPEEFAGSLAAITDESVDLAPIVTGKVGVDGVPQAFTDLAEPERHAKILITP